MMTYRILCASVIALLLWTNGEAQVEGLSYEIGATGEYEFFDDKVGIEDGIFLGGEFGFGLGRLLELRGSYQQGINLQRDFSGLDEDFVGLADMDVDIRRYGGDIQINLLKSAIKPYLSVGAGVQDIEGDGLEESSALYVRGGLGVLLTANDRFAWNLFGNVTTFNANPYSTLMSDTERALNGIDLATRDFDETFNYAVGSKLTFYLGGRDPDEQTDLDRALRKSFSSGLRGVTFEFEPTYSWLDFDDDLPFANAQTIGAKLGVDLGPYFGLRGFYHRGMDDGDFLEFQELNMYGGEMVFNLNEPSGIVPFIALGGGFMDIGDDYVGRPGVDARLEDKGFAMGGLGLRVPLADVFLLKGSARSLIMTNDEIENVVSTQDVTTSWMYQVGIEFKLGKKAKKPSVVEMSEYDKALFDLQQKAEAELNATESENSEEVQRLQAELEALRAIQVKTDAERVKKNMDRGSDMKKVEREVITTPNEDQFVIPRLEDGEVYIRFGDAKNTLSPQGPPQSVISPDAPAAPEGPSAQPRSDAPLGDARMMPQVDTVFIQPDGIVMKPSELQDLLKSVAGTGAARRVVDTTGLPADEAAKRLSFQEEYNELRVENRMLELELNQMKENAKNREKQYRSDLKRELQTEKMRYDQKLLENELRENKKAMRDLEREFEAKMAEAQQMTPAQPQSTQSVDASAQNTAASADMMNDSTGKFLNYKHASAMTIIGLGEANGLGLGFRFHYGIPKTDIDLVPQVYYGLVGQRQYGFDINVQKPVMKGRYERFQPYVGAGLGLAGLEDDNDVVDNTGTFNLIVGTNFHTKHGHFYFDYTNRNFFNMNQLSAGYVFKF